MKFEVRIQKASEYVCKLRGFVALEDACAAALAIVSKRDDEEVIAGVHWMRRGREALIGTMSLRRVDTPSRGWIAECQRSIEAAKVKHKADDERHAFIQRYAKPLEVFRLLEGDKAACAAFYKNDFATVEQFLAGKLQVELPAPKSEPEIPSYDNH